MTSPTSSFFQQYQVHHAKSLASLNQPTLGQPSSRWSHLKRENSFFRQTQDLKSYNCDSSEVPSRVSTPIQTGARRTASSSSRTSSPFQHVFYSSANTESSTSSLSSTLSFSSNSDTTFVNSHPILNRNPSTPFALSPEPSTTPNMNKPEPRRRSHLPYAQHAAGLNQNQVPQHTISSARLSRHLNPKASQSLDQTIQDDDTEDSLKVNVMQLPKNFNQSNASLLNMTGPPPAPPPPLTSTRSSVMSIIPPMQKVWLEDDDDDAKVGKKDLFKSHIMRSKHKSTTSVNRYSGAETNYDKYDSTLTSVSSKRRSRKSFGYGRENDTSDGLMEKIKKSFSSKSSAGTTLEPVIDSPIHETHAEKSASHETTPQKVASFSRGSSALPFSPPASGSLNRHASTSKISTVSSNQKTLSSKSSMRTLSRGQSTKNKLLSLLSSKSSKQSPIDMSPSPRTTVDKSKISGPVNFTHVHAGGAPLRPVSSIATTRSRSQPNRPDRPLGGGEIPIELSGNTPALSSSASSSFQRSSFIASPNTFNNLAADNISISTAMSVDDYSLSSSANKHHRLFFSRLNNAHGSRTSFHGGADYLDDRGVSKRQSIDSFGSSLHPTTSPTRYSIGPSSSLRARSRLSVHSTISIDSNTSYSAVYPGPGGSGLVMYEDQRAAASELLPSMIPIPNNRLSSQDLTQVPPNASARSEYEAPTTIHEEGWF